MMIYSNTSSIAHCLSRARHSHNLERDNFLIPLLPTEELVLGNTANLGELAKQLDKACNTSKHITVDSLFCFEKGR
jgi:hypothetical protein